MTLLTHHDTNSLWLDTIKVAESRCGFTLAKDLEIYLVSLLMRHTYDHFLANRTLALDFLDAQNKCQQERHVALQLVGDECLLFAGLFPEAATRKQVRIRYFVDLGRAAYISISRRTDDLFEKLSLDFVVLMDVLQSIGTHHLLPLDAYELWSEVGSQRAWRILQTYRK